MQQDAHEFLNYLLNTIADLLQEEKSQERQQNGTLVHNGGCDGREEGRKETQQTWVHEIFQGTLTNETRCLNCEAVSQLLDHNCLFQQQSEDAHISFNRTPLFVGEQQRRGLPGSVGRRGAEHFHHTLSQVTSSRKHLRKEGTIGDVCVSSTGASATPRHYAANTSTTASSVAANRKPRRGERRLPGVSGGFEFGCVFFPQDEGEEVTHDPRPPPEAL